MPKLTLKVPIKREVEKITYEVIDGKVCRKNFANTYGVNKLHLLSFFQLCRKVFYKPTWILASNIVQDEDFLKAVEEFERKENVS